MLSKYMVSNISKQPLFSNASLHGFLRGVHAPRQESSALISIVSIVKY